MIKINQLISFIVLLLILLNIPGITLRIFSISVSSPLSYLSFFLLAVLILRSNFNYPRNVILLAVISSLYFVISSLQFNGDYLDIITSYIKFLLYIFGLYTALKYIRQNTLICFMLLGALTILLDALIFRFNDFQGPGYVSHYGRYAGFYLNPNTAAMICLIGYVLTIVKNSHWKILAVVFTFCGFLTLSRTFLLSWFFITAIYLFYNRKYLVRTVTFLIISGFLILNFSEDLNLDNVRFEFLVDLFSGQINYEVLNDDSRQDQWSIFYDDILNSPIIGNGYGTFSTPLADGNSLGVHNTFLLIIGESGFVPLMLLMTLVSKLFVESYTVRRKSLKPLLLLLVLFVQCLVSHNFFDSGLMLIIFLIISYLLKFDYDNIKISRHVRNILQ